MQSFLNPAHGWKQVRRIAGMFIPKRYRRCRICGGQFENGVVQVDGGFVTGAMCGSCVARTITAPDERSPARPAVRACPPFSR
jgi:hypothetical protein